jgi:hypothetical protein
MRQPEQESQNKTAITIQPQQGKQNRTELPAQDSTARTGQSEQYSWYRTRSGEDRWDRTA